MRGVRPRWVREGRAGCGPQGSRMMTRMRRSVKTPHAVLHAVLRILAAASLLASCRGGPVTGPVYRDPNMDFGVIQTVGVMPFQNLSRDNLAAERVRDVFINRLLSTGAIYVLPVGEVARAAVRAEVEAPATPSIDEVIKLGNLLKVQALVTGVVEEYGEVRSGASAANVISMSVKLLEVQTGRIVWGASSTKGGIGVSDRLFGGGGKPMDNVTRDAVDDVIRKL